MCRIFSCRNGAAEEMPSLWQGLACSCPLLARKETAVVAFTGSGGKTTWIYRLAEELCRQGKRVAVATTTHMYEPPPELLADDAETMKSLLEGRGFAVIGQRDGRGKITYGGDALFTACRALADVVLVEADGSRRQPLKCFGPHEPVIPPRTDCIVRPCGGIVCLEPSSGRGLFPLGTKPMGSTASRYGRRICRRRHFVFGSLAPKLEGAGRTCFQSGRW